MHGILYQHGEIENNHYWLVKLLMCPAKKPIGFPTIWPPQVMFVSYKPHEYKFVLSIINPILNLDLYFTNQLHFSFSQN